MPQDLVEVTLRSVSRFRYRAIQKQKTGMQAAIRFCGGLPVVNRATITSLFVLFMQIWCIVPNTAVVYVDQSRVSHSRAFDWPTSHFRFCLKIFEIAVY